MKPILQASAALCLLAVGAAALWVAASAAQSVADLTPTERRIAASVEATAATLKETRSDLAVTQAALINVVDRQLSGISGQLAGVARSADETLAQVRSTVAEFATVPGRIQPVLTEAQATIAAARAPIASSDQLVRDLRPQALGLVAGWKVVGGETATTMRDWRRATPALITGVNQIVANSNRTTDATAQVMGNFAKATKPLPLWLRIGLGVAPPLAQTAAGAATVYSLGR